METKNGKLGIVAKTGGIKFEGDEEWYNPTESCKTYVKPEFKGKWVEITLVANNPHKFSFIKLTDSKELNIKAIPEANTSPQTRDNYWAEKDSRISRHGAINTALEAISISASLKLKPSEGDPKPPTPEQLLELAIHLAESKILPFVERK